MVRHVHHVFNMGIGFCMVVRPENESQALDIVRRHGKACQRIGRVTDDPTGRVKLTQARIEMAR